MLDRVLSVFRPLVSYSQWASGNQAVGVVATANNMFTNSNRLIVVDQMVFNCQVLRSIGFSSHAPHVSIWFGFPASYDEYTALVKVGNVASGARQESSQWNVSLVEPGYRDLLSYVTFLLVMWLVLCCSFSTRELV